MDHNVRRYNLLYRRLIIPKLLDVSLKKVFCLFHISTILFLPVTAQQLVEGEGLAKIDDLSFHLKGVTVDLSPDNHPIYKANLSVGSINFGFNKIDIKSRIFEQTNGSRIQFGGPDFNLNQFHFSIKSKTPNILSNIVFDLKKDRISAPSLGLRLIGEALELYLQDHPFPPDSIQTLFDEDYLMSHTYPFNEWEWNFYIISPSKVKAISTEKFIMGSGLTIELDLLSWEMSGYGIPNPNQYEWNDWELTLDIQQLVLQFLSQLTIDISDSLNKVHFVLNRGKFQLDNFLMIANPDNNLEQRFSFSIGKYGIALRNMDIHIGLDNYRPTLLAGSGELILRNLEVKIPEEIYEQPEIKNIFENIGIYNGLLKIRRFEIKGVHGKDGNSEINLTLMTPFGEMESAIHIHANELGGQKHHYEFHESNIHIRRLSPGLSQLINHWEVETQNRLSRKGDTIILTVYGDISSPKIKGIHFNQPTVD